MVTPEIGMVSPPTAVADPPEELPGVEAVVGDVDVVGGELVFELDEHDAAIRATAIAATGAFIMRLRLRTDEPLWTNIPLPPPWSAAPAWRRFHRDAAVFLADTMVAGKSFRLGLLGRELLRVGQENPEVAHLVGVTARRASAVRLSTVTACG